MPRAFDIAVELLVYTPKARPTVSLLGVLIGVLSMAWVTCWPINAALLGMGEKTTSDVVGFIGPSSARAPPAKPQTL